MTKLSMQFKNFDADLPNNNSEVFVLGKDNDLIIVVFVTNDGSRSASTLGVLYTKSLETGNLIYTTTVYKDDPAFIGWCYTYDVNIEETPYHYERCGSHSNTCSNCKWMYADCMVKDIPVDKAPPECMNKIRMGDAKILHIMPWDACDLWESCKDESGKDVSWSDDV